MNLREEHKGIIDLIYSNKSLTGLSSSGIGKSFTAGVSGTTFGKQTASMSSLNFKKFISCGISGEESAPATRNPS